MKYVLIAAGLLLAACATEPTASATPAAQRDCFNGDDVSGFNIVGDHTVKINVGPSRDYLLTTDRSVTDLRSVEHIALHGTPNGLICTGNGLGVELRGGDLPALPWIVTNIARAPQTPPPAAAH